MGNLADLKQSVADGLDGVADLDDASIIAAKDDIQSQVHEALGKTSGLAAVVELIDGENTNSDDIITSKMGLRLKTGVSVTLWMIPIHLRGDDSQPPLTEGPRDPVDILESTIKRLNGMAINGDSDSCPNESTHLVVKRWRKIPVDPPFVVNEIQCQITTQLANS